jgi:transmembrane sensor
MTEHAQQDVRAEAIGWHLRLQGAGAQDWDSFVRWLEAAPAHAAAYDEVARAEAELDADAFPSSAAANDDRDEETRRPWRLGRTIRIVAAVAACLVLAFVALPWLGFGSDRYEIATAAGEQRIVPLDDGSRVALNGATRLILDRANPRFAELEAGEATFTIRHHSDDPFIVAAGDHRIHDVGTAFNVVREEDGLTVEVIEGEVRYDPHRAAIRLTAGQTLAVREHDGHALLGRRDPGTIAGWRRGQLSYRGAPLDRVARDLARSLGALVSVDPGIAATPFTGSVRVAGGAESVLTGFAATLGMEARRDGNAWRIGPPRRAPR